jgi:hypothetical protein
VLRKILGTKRCEIIGEVHIEDLHKLCTSPNIIRVIKLRRIRWTGRET